MKRLTITIGILAMATSLSGCLTILKPVFVGHTQKITVTTVPADASCDVWRSGGVIAKVQSTPQTIEIDKSKSDLLVECSKRGFYKGSYVDKSSEDFSSGTNVAMELLTGTSIDEMRGTKYSYDDDTVTIELRRVK